MVEEPEEVVEEVVVEVEDCLEEAADEVVVVEAGLEVVDEEVAVEVTDVVEEETGAEETEEEVVAEEAAVLSAVLLSTDAAEAFSPTLLSTAEETAVEAVSAAKLSPTPKACSFFSAQPVSISAATAATVIVFTAFFITISPYVLFTVIL